MSVDNPSSLDGGWVARLSGALVANGYPFFPIERGKKRTHWKDHTNFGDRLPNERQVARWHERYADYGVAIACGRFVVAVDIDELDPQNADHLEALTIEILGPTPLVRVGRRPKRLLVYRADGSAKIGTFRSGLVELLGAGRYFVGFNIHPDTGQPYEWTASTPIALALANVPAADASAVARLREALDVENARHHRATGPRRGSDAGTHHSRRDGRRKDDNLDRVADGRDTYLTRLVWRYSVEGDANAIAVKAWDEFQRTAELDRPRRDGDRPWSFRDALDKARDLLRRGKRRPRPRSRDGFWTPAAKQSFRHVVNAAGAAGRLSPSAVAVSHAMLEYVQGNGSAFASVDRLATAIGITADTVKKARRLLLRKGFWTCVREERGNRGGRGCIAHYKPSAAVLEGAEVSADLADPDRHGAGRNGGHSGHQNSQGEGGGYTLPVSPSKPNTQHEENSQFLEFKSVSTECRGGVSQGAAPDVARVPHRMSVGADL